MQELTQLEKLLVDGKSRLVALQKQLERSYQDKSDSMTAFQKIFFGIFLIMAVYFYGVYQTKVELLTRQQPISVASPTPRTQLPTTASPSPTTQPSTKPSVVPAKTTNIPKPTSTPTPAPQQQVQPSWPDRPTAEATVKANAMKEWGDNYEMVQYEFNNQMEAYSWLIQQTQYPAIMIRAQSEWGDNYEMVKYEYENQVKAYKSL
ncbi:hypothetical protein DCC61_01500 [Candidatus Microgenomates bacterium]|nr:MAG: hypothetical protein DCC61_01500 [Candidatus Microgenomates bacterium]